MCHPKQGLLARHSDHDCKLWEHPIYLRLCTSWNRGNRDPALRRLLDLFEYPQVPPPPGYYDDVARRSRRISLEEYAKELNERPKEGEKQ